MKGTKKFFTIFLLFFIAVVFITGCSSPIGGLLVDKNRNYIKVTQHKIVYNKDDLFTVENTELFYFFEGRKEPIDINNEKVDIKIIEYPNLPGDLNSVDKDTGYKLEIIGKKTIVITYLGMVDDCSIYVAAPGEVPNPDGGGGISIIPVWP